MASRCNYLNILFQVPRSAWHILFRWDFFFCFYKFLYFYLVITHLIHHLLDGVKEFGPTHSTWMYAYQRFNRWLYRRVMNRCYPESTLMETYAVGIVILILYIYMAVPDRNQGNIPLHLECVTKFWTL